MGDKIAVAFARELLQAQREEIERLASALDEERASKTKRCAVITPDGSLKRSSRAPTTHFSER
jgi:rRNA-processing protein FCF1